MLCYVIMYEHWLLLFFFTFFTINIYLYVLLIQSFPSKYLIIAMVMVMPPMEQSTSVLASAEPYRHDAARSIITAAHTLCAVFQLLCSFLNLNRFQLFLSHLQLCTSNITSIEYPCDWGRDILTIYFQ